MNTRDPEFDAITESEIFLEAKDRLQIALDAESSNRTRAKEDMMFREGDGQWDDDPITSASLDEPELTINLTDAMCARVVNNIKQQRPRGKAHPVGDGADIEIAEVINGIGRHVETRSEASVAYDTASDCAVTAGWGYFRLLPEFVAPDSFQKDLRIFPILNPFTVYMDPAAIMPAGQDQGWCIISIMEKRAEYRRNNPRASNAGWQDGNRDHYEWENREEIRLAEYFRIREKEEKLYGLRGVDGTEFTRFQSEMPSEEALQIAGISIEGDRMSSRRAVEWFKLNGVKVVQREQFPGQWIPVFRVVGNQRNIDGKVVRRGMVRFMQDPQRMVNYGETAKIKRLGLAPKAPWVGAEGQFDGHPEWDDANRQSYSKLVYKPVTIQTANGEVPLPAPQRQPPAQLEQGFSEFVQGMRTNLLAVAGMPNEPGADMQGQVISGRALRKRQFLSDQSHYQYYDNTTLAIAQCWRVMVEWIPHYFREPGRIQRIIGEDSTPQMVTLNEQVTEGEGEDAVERVKNDLTIGRYDVVMDTGPGYETRREEGAENLIELLKVQALAEIIAKTGPDLVFRSIDHPYMQELADRLMAATPDGLKKIVEGLSSRAKSIVMALGNENAALKQQLQAVQGELNSKLKVETLRATVKAHDVEVSNETKRLDTESRERTAVQIESMRGHVTLAKEEIAAGASLLNTHAEAKHHRAEAERMIEQASQTEKTV